MESTVVWREIMPGGTALRLLEHLDVGSADDDVSLAAIKTLDGVIARAQAMQLQCIQRFVEQRFGDAHYAAGEIAMELTWTRRHTERQVGLAHQLTQGLPETLARMRAGEINRDKASALAELTETLDDDARRKVEEKVVAKAGKRSTRWLRDTARREILRVDPEAAERRRAQRKKERRMEKYPSDDGMSWLSFYLPAEKAEAIYRRVNAIAKGARTREDPRSMDEMRADVAMGLLLGASSNVTTRIEVRVDATTLMGHDDKPGTLSGYGPVSAGHARELAGSEDSDWYRVLTDPVTGIVVDYGRIRYRPTIPLREIVNARDQRCCALDCYVPASQSEFDHTIPFRDPQGKTAYDSTGPACSFHNKLKELGWTVRQLRPGHFVWVSPAGRMYDSIPGLDDLY
jgi:hypothetical protein